MNFNYHLSAIIFWIITDNSHQQTTPGIPPPYCLDYPDALRCFQSFNSTSDFSVAMKTCHTHGIRLPMIVEKEERKKVVEKSLLSRMVPFWIDLRSLTTVSFSPSGDIVTYMICGVGRNPDQSSANIVSFDYCNNKRKALCCNHLLHCYPTEGLLTWAEADKSCKEQGKTMYGTGATVTEIQQRFIAIPDCPNCWIGLTATVTSLGYSDSGMQVDSDFLQPLPKPGPCAVVTMSGDGKTVRCNANESYHIICEIYVKKVLLKANNSSAQVACPPEGCTKIFPRGGDIKVATAVIVCVGLPICLAIGLVAGVIHRQRNPIYNRIPEQRRSRQSSSVSYIPGGANTMF